MKNGLFLAIALCVHGLLAQQSSDINLVFKAIPTRWDEGIPLGNGTLGALIWQSGDKLRMSLDRADVWDLRPMPAIEKYSHRLAVAAVRRGDLDDIHPIADVPYDTSAGPTKLPVAALEWDISGLGELRQIELDIASAKCLISWRSGATMEIWIHATEPMGWYSWAGFEGGPTLIAPKYTVAAGSDAANQVVDGASLTRLGYAAGTVTKHENYDTYTQPTWGGAWYQVCTGVAMWPGNRAGMWSVSAHYPEQSKAETAEHRVKKVLKSAFRNYHDMLKSHLNWWEDYWQASSVSMADPVIERQYYLDMYKFGCVARAGAPPISLQAVWTADNGHLPPWKGDLHHDLNTQLSYWPAYTGNHLSEAVSFTDWLWENKGTFELFANRVFGTSGLNVPGVSTLRGASMGGWHQYSLSPTVSAWLAQQFYWQWTFSGDSIFLRERAIPWVQGVATHLEGMLKPNGSFLELEISSSPEFHDNSLAAWYADGMTNYDIALCRSVFRQLSRMYEAVGNRAAASKYRVLDGQLPKFDTDTATGSLTIAPNEPYAFSHRHFSHLMAIFPLELLDATTDKALIGASVAQLEKYGAADWTGYSHAWLANIYARQHRGEDAAKQLRDFATCYCSSNSFHLNGNTCTDRTDLSNMHYRPFTLEGNFASAAGVQAMLLQSQHGVTTVFPAIPKSWQNTSFETLRAEGGFLISATQQGAIADKITILATQTGILKLSKPFFTVVVEDKSPGVVVDMATDIWIFEMKKGDRIILQNGYE